jgi:tetratricopeptide (TPR) repeat protein
MGSTKSLLIAFLMLIFGTTLSAQNNLSKAEKQFELGAYNLALETYKDVLKSYNGNLKALVGAGDCYRLLNKMDAARKMYENAVIRDDVDPSVYDKLGKVLMSLRQYDEAKSYFKRYELLVGVKDYPFPTACDFALNADNRNSEYEVDLEFANTAGSEFSPAFYNNNLVFASSRSSKRTSSRRTSVFSDNAKTKLFSSSINSFGNLENAKSLHADWDKSLSEGPLSYCEAKNWVVFTKNNFVDGTRQIPEAKLELSMYFAEVDASGNWSKEVPFEHNGPGYSTGYGVFSEDGNTLVFASDRQDNSLGGFDLFICFYENGSWSKPVNLGAKVNTAGDEISPFLLGDALYFSSNYLPGFGGMDIFVSNRDNNGYFSMPINMGKGINSSRDDYGFIYDPFRNLGFLASNRLGGKGNEDLYSVKKNQDHLMLVVIDALTQKPISDALVDLSSCGGSLFSTDAQGRLSYSLLKEGACSAVVSKNDYTSKEISISNFGSTSSKKLVVELVSLAKSFEYAILENGSKAPVNNAMVNITSAVSGKSFEAYSDDKGRIVLPIATEENYMVTIRAEGYTSISQRILVPVGVNSDYVQGTFLLDPSLPSLGAVEPKSEALDLKMYDSPSGRAKSVPVYSYSSAYYIQLASFRGDVNVDLSNYESKLNSVGSVLLMEESGKQKVRVGPFSSKAEASAQLASVSNAGYKDAFVLPGQQVVAVDIAEEEEFSAKGGLVDYGNSDTAVTFEWAPQEQIKSVSEGTYYIQLCAVKKGSGLDDPKFNALNSFGELSERQKGSLTTKLLGAYETKEEANKILKEVRKKGFKDAFIVR